MPICNNCRVVEKGLNPCRRLLKFQRNLLRVTNGLPNKETDFYSFTSNEKGSFVELEGLKLSDERPFGYQLNMKLDYFKYLSKK